MSYNYKTNIFNLYNKFIIQQVVPSQTTPELANSASSTVLLLLVNLRLCYKPINHKSVSQSITSPQHSLLNTSKSLFQTPLRIASNELSLKYILKHIIEWIILTGSTFKKLRVYLYASLLNYMHIIKRDDSKPYTIEDNW